MQTNQQGDFFFINTTTQTGFSPNPNQMFFCARRVDQNPGFWCHFVCLPSTQTTSLWLQCGTQVPFSQKKEVVSWHNPGGENILTATLLWKQFGNIGLLLNSSILDAVCLFVCVYSVIYDLNVTELCDPFLRTTVHLQTRTQSEFSAALSKRPADMFSSYSNSWLY